MKNSRLLKLFLILTVCFVGLPGFHGESWADEKKLYWEFKIPIEVKDLMPEVWKVHLSIEVHDKGNKLIGFTTTNEAVNPDGTVSAEMVVKVYPNKGTDPFSGFKYKVTMKLVPEKGNTTKPNDTDELWCKSMPGTALVHEVEGKF